MKVSKINQTCRMCMVLDLEYRPSENNNNNINSAGSSQSFELPSAHPSDHESFSESTSDNSDDKPDNNNCMENYLDILDFGFSRDLIEIKLEIIKVLVIM